MFVCFQRGVFDKLKHLQELDISDNKIRSSNSLLEVIGQIHSLRVLKMRNCGPKVYRKEPNAYSTKIFNQMRLLEEIDNVQNPHPLTDVQWEAVEFLHTQYGVSGNDLQFIDLTDRKLQKRHFWPIILALNALVTQVKRTVCNHQSQEQESSEEYDMAQEPDDLEARGRDQLDLLDMIGPKELFLSSGNFSKEAIMDYFFLIVNHVPSLSELDGIAISERDKIGVMRRALQLEETIREQKPRDEDFELVPVQKLTLEFLRLETFRWMNPDQISEDELTESKVEEQIQDEGPESDLFKPPEPEHTQPQQSAIESDSEAQEINDSDPENSSQCNSHLQPQHTLNFDERKEQQKLVIARRAVLKGRRKKTRSFVSVIDQINGLEQSVSNSPIGASHSNNNTQEEEKEVSRLDVENQNIQETEEIQRGLEQAESELSTDVVISLQESNEMSIKDDQNTVQSLEDRPEVLQPDDITLMFIQQHIESIPIFKLYEEQMRISSNNQVMILGGILEKVELAIVTLQIFSQISNFNVEWPSLFRFVGDYLGLSILAIENVFSDIDSNYYYLKYALTVIIPMAIFLLFVLPYKRTWWNKIFGEMFIVPMIGTALLWIFGMILSVATAFSLDSGSLEKFLNRELLPASFFWIMGSFMIGFTLVSGAALFSLLAYRINRNNDNFLRLFFVSYRRSLLLFILSILYTPIVHTLLSVYRCDEEQKTLLLYSDQSCPKMSAWKNVPPMYYISGVLFVIYAIAIPIFFLLLVMAGYRKMEKKFGFKGEFSKLKDLKHFEKDMKQELKEKDPNSILVKMKRKYIAKLKPGEIEMRESIDNEKNEQDSEKEEIESQEDPKLEAHEAKERKELGERYLKAVQNTNSQRHFIEKVYHQALRDTISSSAFLFGPFDRIARYTKPLLLLESVLIAMAGTFLFDYPYVQLPVAAVILFIYLLYGIIVRPYLDPAQDALFIFVQLSLLLQCLLGYILVWKKSILRSETVSSRTIDIIVSAFLYIIIGLQLIFTMCVVLSYTARRLMAKIRTAYDTRRLSKKEQDQIQESKRKEDEVRLELEVLDITQTAQTEEDKQGESAKQID